MDGLKPNMRSRKVVNYVGMNVDDSEDSDDDFQNVRQKAPSSTPAVQNKPQKLNKLKLGARIKETKKSDVKHEDSSFQLKPKNSGVDKVTHIQPSLVPGASILNEIDLPVAEPDVNVHRPSSQETIVCASDGCLSSSSSSNSSQETTDSSEPSSPASSTFQLLTVEEPVKPMKETLVAEIIKPKFLNVNRVTKRRIASEDDSSQDTKKSKIDCNEEIQIADIQDDVIHPHNTEVPSCLVVLKKLPKHISPQFEQKDVAQHAASPVAQRNSQNSQSVEPRTKLLEDKLGEAFFTQMYIPKITGNSKMEAVEIEKATELAISPVPKSAKRTTKTTGKQELRKGKPENIPLKSDAKNPNEKRSKLKGTNKPEAVGKWTDSPLKIDNEHHKLKNILETNDKPSKDIKTKEPINILEPLSPSSTKISTKIPVWNPPGKAGSQTNPTKVQSPMIGLRIGLSRNRRANKPLHPDAKLNI